MRLEKEERITAVRYLDSHDVAANYPLYRQFYLDQKRVSHRRAEAQLTADWHYVALKSRAR
jgi:hypothetical protein